MTEMTSEVRRLVERPNYAHIATLMPDGAPHSVPVWIDLEGDNLVVLDLARARLAISSVTPEWRSRSPMLISRSPRR
jgi:hypothetical protein